MKYLWLIALLFLAGCSGSSPTAPTPPVVTVPPPVVVTPPTTPEVIAPPIPPPPPFPPNDVRFDMTFYRQFVHNALDGPIGVLRRQTEAPRIYLRIVDDAGRAMDALTLDQTQAALESTTGRLTGVFGLAGLERGTGTRQGQRGWITVRWSGEPELIDNGTRGVCGRAAVGGDLLTLYPRTPNCRCGGGPAVSLSTVKHELGHALGFWHTDSREDLMYRSLTSCDQNPSAREIYHASVAYQRPVGSPAP